MNPLQEFWLYISGFDLIQLAQTYFLVPLGMFLGALVNAALGFGGAMVAFPLIVWALPIAVIAPLFNGMGFIQFGLGLPNDIENGFKHKIIYPLIVGNIIGALIGSYLLVTTQNTILVKVVGGLILFFEVVYLFIGRKNKTLESPTQAYNPSIDLSNEKSAKQNNFVFNSLRESIKLKNLPHLSIGIVSGAMSGAFGMGGPPLVIYLRQVLKDKDSIRSTLLAFWYINVFVQFLIQRTIGLWTYQVVALLLISLPINLAGVWVGKKLFSRFNNQSYQIMVSILTIIGGIILLLR